MKNNLKLILIATIFLNLSSCNQNDINPAGIDEITFNLKQFTRLNDESVTLNLKVIQPDSSIKLAEAASINRQELILNEEDANGTYQVFVEVGLTSIFASDVQYEINYSVLPETVVLDADSLHFATSNVAGNQFWYEVEKVDGKFRRPELIVEDK